jgi:hypothetical protein
MHYLSAWPLLVTKSAQSMARMQGVGQIDGVNLCTSWPDVRSVKVASSRAHRIDIGGFEAQAWGTSTGPAQKVSGV